jgi:hypothetical protein
MPMTEVQSPDDHLTARELGCGDRQDGRKEVVYVHQINALATQPEREPPNVEGGLGVGKRTPRRKGQWGQPKRVNLIQQRTRLEEHSQLKLVTRAEPPQELNHLALSSP